MPIESKPHSLSRNRRVNIFIKPCIVAAALLLSPPAMAQGAQPPMKLFISSAEVQNLITKARAVPKRPGVGTAELILAVEPFRAHVEIRTSVTPAAVHHRVAGFGYVIAGSCTLVTGGTLTGVKPGKPGAKDLSGAGIAGGTSQHLEKGDYFMIPAEVPHQFQDIKGELIMMGMHLPMPDSSK